MWQTRVVRNRNDKLSVGRNPAASPPRSVAFRLPRSGLPRVSQQNGSVEGPDAKRKHMGALHGRGRRFGQRFLVVQNQRGSWQRLFDQRHRISTKRNAARAHRHEGACYIVFERGGVTRELVSSEFLACTSEFLGIH